MNILVYHQDIFSCDNIIRTFQEQGHHVDVPALPEINHLWDEAGEAALSGLLSSHHYDFVFSVNYLAAIARVCHLHQIRYVSWTLDTPLISMQTNTVYYPENRLFTFDETEYNDFRQKGVNQIYYLPLAGYPTEAAVTEEMRYPVSFVGNLYDRNEYDDFCALIPDYLCGFLDAVLEAQLHFDSSNIIEPMITDEIWDKIRPYVTAAPNRETDFPDAELLLKLQFNTRVLSYKSSQLKRICVLNALAAAHCDVHLFTTSDPTPLRGVHIHPAADYEGEAPAVYASSRINLNITSPNLKGAIPLRVWDVLSVGGFLLTDHRPQYDGLLKDGEDLVFYDGIGDLLQKASYYLTHEEERCRIAENGRRKIRETHNLSCRLQKILDII